MRFAAFFRNLNLGRPGSPDRAQFVAAMEAAGAREVVSVLSHGNAAFNAGNQTQAVRLMTAACGHLHEACGWNGTVHVRSFGHLARLIEAAPFAAAPVDDVHERCVTFLPAHVALTALPLASARRDLEVFRASPTEAFSITRLVDGRPGGVNALLERLVKAPLTTRNWNTVVRVVERHG
jgi:uncharacterized protein (DUF1697 family)